MPALYINILLTLPLAGGGQSIIDVPDAADILLRSLQHLHEQPPLAGDEKSYVLNALIRALGIFPTLPEDCLPRASSKLREWADAAPGDLKKKLIQIFGNGESRCISYREISISTLLCVS